MGVDDKIQDGLPEDDLEATHSRSFHHLRQQLVKNLFFGTGRSIPRKGAKKVPWYRWHEFVLGKTSGFLGRYLTGRMGGPGILWCRGNGVSLLRTKPASRTLSAGTGGTARLQFCPAPLKRRRRGAMNNYERDFLLAHRAIWVW